MKPVEEGTNVRVIRVDPGDAYQVGELVEVAEVACDGTFRGRELATGKVKGWLNWAQAEEAVGIGWDFLASALSARGRLLLTAFDGHRSLQLKQSVEDELVLLVPNLEAEILAATTQVRARAEPKRKKRKDKGREVTSTVEPESAAGPQEDFDVEGTLEWGLAPPF